MRKRKGCRGPVVYVIVSEPWEERGRIGLYSFRRHGSRYAVAGDRLLREDGKDIGEIIHETEAVGEHNQFLTLIRGVEELHAS